MTSFEERPTDEASEDPPETIPSLNETGEARGPSAAESESPEVGYPAGESAGRPPDDSVPPGVAKQHPESVEKPTERDEATEQDSQPSEPGRAAD